MAVRPACLSEPLAFRRIWSSFALVAFSQVEQFQRSIFADFFVSFQLDLWFLSKKNEMVSKQVTNSTDGGESPWNKIIGNVLYRGRGVLPTLVQFYICSCSCSLLVSKFIKAAWFSFAHMMLALPLFIFLNKWYWINIFWSALYDARSTIVYFPQ